MIHVKIWTGAGNLTITDMQHANKRGKKCRTLKVCGWIPGSTKDEELNRIYEATTNIMHHCERLDRSADFDTVREEIVDMIERYGISQVRYYDDEIRAIDAPKEKLTAGREGVWSAKADESGIYAADLTDHHNDPRLCTHDQTNARAYAIACKAWPQVERCATFHEVWTVLSNAGARLHYWCAMD